MVVVRVQQAVQQPVGHDVHAVQRAWRRLVADLTGVRPVVSRGGTALCSPAGPQCRAEDTRVRTSGGTGTARQGSVRAEPVVGARRSAYAQIENPVDQVPLRGLGGRWSSRRRPGARWSSRRTPGARWSSRRTPGARWSSRRSVLGGAVDGRLVLGGAVDGRLVLGGAVDGGLVVGADIALAEGTPVGEVVDASLRCRRRAGQPAPERQLGRPTTRLDCRSILRAPRPPILYDSTTSLLSGTDHSRFPVIRLLAISLDLAPPECCRTSWLHRAQRFDETVPNNPRPPPKIQ